MNKQKTISAICYLATVIIFIAVTLWGIYKLNPGDEMGYVILNFYIIIPITVLIIGFVQGADNTCMKWLYPIMVGAAGIISLNIIFSNVSLVILLFTAVPALLGVLIRLSINKLKAQGHIKGKPLAS